MWTAVLFPITVSIAWPRIVGHRCRATVAAKGTRWHQTYKKRICSGRRFDNLAVTPTKQSNGKSEAVAAETEQSGTVKSSNGFFGC